MKRAILVALGTGAVISSAAAIAIGTAAISTSSETLSRTEYEAALAGIRGTRAEILSACETEAGAVAKEICRTEADASELVRVADIEHSFRRTHDAARNAQRARIDARYQVARARCQAIGGAFRDQCLINAHASRGRALLDAQAPYEIRN
jgi:hyperosmotically inducible periplasmic protein